MINKEILCVTDMHITPSAVDNIEMEQTIITNELEYGYPIRKVIKQFVSEIDYEIHGITTEGQNVTITFRDPKELTVTYEEQSGNF